jgi:predicted  nucleic acid-binding Zn-ribbon protein
MISALTLESEKGKLAGEVETLNGKLSALDELKTSLEEELKQVKRPAVALKARLQGNIKLRLWPLCVRG